MLSFAAGPGSFRSLIAAVSAAIRRQHGRRAAVETHALAVAVMTSKAKAVDLSAGGSREGV
jgi:hypothetical protein